MTKKTDFSFYLRRAGGVMTLAAVAILSPMGAHATTIITTDTTISGTDVLSGSPDTSGPTSIELFDVDASSGSGNVVLNNSDQILSVEDDINGTPGVADINESGTNQIVVSVTGATTDDKAIYNQGGTAQSKLNQGNQDTTPTTATVYLGGFADFNNTAAGSQTAPSVLMETTTAAGVGNAIELSGDENAVVNNGYVKANSSGGVSTAGVNAVKVDGASGEGSTFTNEAGGTVEVTADAAGKAFDVSTGGDFALTNSGTIMSASAAPMIDIGASAEGVMINNMDGAKLSADITGAAAVAAANASGSVRIINRGMLEVTGISDGNKNAINLGSAYNYFENCGEIKGDDTTNTNLATIDFSNAAGTNIYLYDKTALPKFSDAGSANSVTFASGAKNNVLMKYSGDQSFDSSSPAFTVDPHVDTTNVSSVFFANNSGDSITLTDIQVKDIGVASSSSSQELGGIGGKLVLAAPTSGSSVTDPYDVTFLNTNDAWSGTVEIQHKLGDSGTTHTHDLAASGAGDFTIILNTDEGADLLGDASSAISAGSSGSEHGTLEIMKVGSGHSLETGMDLTTYTGLGSSGEFQHFKNVKVNTGGEYTFTPSSSNTSFTGLEIASGSTLQHQDISNVTALNMTVNGTLDLTTSANTNGGTTASFQGDYTQNADSTVMLEVEYDVAGATLAPKKTLTVDATGSTSAAPITLAGKAVVSHLDSVGDVVVLDDDVLGLNVNLADEINTTVGISGQWDKVVPDDASDPEKQYQYTYDPDNSSGQQHMYIAGYRGIEVDGIVDPETRALAMAVQGAIAGNGDLIKLLNKGNMITDPVEQAKYYRQITPMAFSTMHAAGHRLSSTVSNSIFSHLNNIGMVLTRKALGWSMSPDRMPNRMPNMMGGKMNNTSGWWLDIHGTPVHKQKGENDSSLDHSSYGFVGGVDYIRKAGKVYGLSLNVDRHHMDNDIDAKGNINTLGVSWYHSYYNRDSYINGSLNFVKESGDMTRTVNSGGSTYSYDSSPDSYRYGLNLEAGSTDNYMGFDVRPWVRLNYLHTVNKGFEEEGAGAPLTVLKNATDSMVVGLGLGISKDLKADNYMWTPTFTLRGEHDLKKTDSYTSSSYFTAVGAGQPFETNLGLPDRSALYATLNLMGKGGIFCATSSNDYMYLDVEQEWRSGFNATRFRLGYTFMW